MRRCPTCQATYDDEQTYCTFEGTRLETVVTEDPQPTMFAPAATMVSSPQMSGDLRSEQSLRDWPSEPPLNRAPSAPFSQTLEAQAGARPNTALKILGLALVLALGLGLGYMLAGFISNKSQPDATASAQTDAAVLAELKELEDKMTGASIKGDKDALGRLLADDYSATGADGKFYNRQQTLYSTEPMPSVTSWSVDNARLLSRSETSATLSAVVTFRSGDQMERQQVTDTFMKRKGAWQLVASQSTLLK